MTPPDPLDRLIAHLQEAVFALDDYKNRCDMVTWSEDTYHAYKQMSTVLKASIFTAQTWQATAQREAAGE